MTRRTRTLAALAVVVITAAAAVLVIGPGYHASQSRMRSGMVWLASNKTGEAVLLDGATAEVAARVPIGTPGAALTVAQQDGAALVVDQDTGRLSSVDTATLTVTRSAAVLPWSPGSVMKHARNKVYGVDVHSGTVVSIDTGTLAPQGKPARLAQSLRPDSVVVAGDGRLWAIDDHTGDLVWLAKGEGHTRSATTKSGYLAVTADQPAFVDPDRGTAELLSPETSAVTRSARMDPHAADAAVVGGSADQSRLLIASSTRGELVTCTFDTGSCTDPVRISAPGAELGTPVEADNHAVVPDHSTGEVTIVDLATSRVEARRQLFAKPHRFDLIAHDGIVFFNDPNGSTAGVLDLAGNVRTITKYAEDPVAAETPPAPQPRAQAAQVTKSGYDRHKPGPTIPGPVDHSTRNPSPSTPASAASIVVSPGNRGEVGDEFELTMRLQSPIGGWTTHWILGDGTEAYGATIRHRWREQGVFTVQATATFATGARVQAETTVNVDPQEEPPRITALNVRRPKPVIGEPVHFSANYTSKPDRWAWTVSKPGSAAPEAIADTTEFRHAFDAPGTYAVTLSITKGTLTATSSREFTVGRGAVKAWGLMNQVPRSAESGVIAIDAGDEHALGLKADGSVIAWGSNDHGQTEVPPDATDGGVVAIAAGGSHSLALKQNGAVIAWGNDGGPLSAIPPEAEHGVIAIAAGRSHSLALKENGMVIGWGDNADGQVSIPPQAKSGVIAISAGTAHSLALKSDGSVVHWGNNDAAMNMPEALTDVVAVAAGHYHSLAVKSDGSVIGWGWSHADVLSIPEEAMSGVAAISTSVHALAMKSDGSVIGWGLSRPGGSNVPPEYSVDAMAVAAGVHFSLVLL